MIQRELRWRVGRRRDPNARSNLHEVIESSVIVAIAPLTLNDEIAEHIADIARDCGVPQSVVHGEWKKVQGLIHFSQPSTNGKNIDCPDPDDLPYAVLCFEVAASAVYSSDSDFDSPDIPWIPADADFDTALRDYARDTAFTVGIKIGATITLTVSFGIMASLLRLLMDFGRRLPVEVKVAAVFLLAAAFIHPTSRSKILEMAKTGWRRRSDPACVVPPALMRLIEDYSAASTRALQARKTVQENIPPRKKGTLLAIVKRVCVTSSRPLPLGEIEQLVKAEGYKSRSIHHTAYLRQLIRHNPAFAEIEPGLWKLRSG